MTLIFICFMIINLDFILGSSSGSIQTCVEKPPSSISSLISNSTGVQAFLGSTPITNNSRIYTSCHCGQGNCGSEATVLWCIIRRSNVCSNSGRWYSPLSENPVDNNGKIAFCTEQNHLQQCRFGNRRDTTAEGFYTCQATNELIRIGVYTSNTPLSEISLSITNTRFELTSLRNPDPPQFSLSFTVINGPVISISCTVNDTALNVTQLVSDDESSIVLRFQSRNEGQYKCIFFGNNIIYSNNTIDMSSFTTTTNITVIQKPTHLRVHWINSNTAEANWSIPSNIETGSAVITGYEIFYNVIINSAKSLIRYNMTAETTEAMIPNLIGCLNYSFCVVAYSDDDYTLPSECSDMVLLTNNVMSPCADQCTSTSGSSHQPPQIQTCVETLFISSLQLSVTEARVSPSQLTGTVCLSQLESSLQSPLVAGIIGILLLTNLLTVTALIGSCVCILRSKQNKLTLGRGTSHYEQITLTESSHTSTAGIVTNNNSESHNTGTTMVNNSSGSSDENVSGNIYSLVSEEHDIDQHVPNQYETPIDLIKQQQPTTTTTTTGDGAATGGGSPAIYSIQDENPTTSVAASTAGQYTYATVNKRQEGTVPTEGYTYATVNKKQSMKEQ